MDSLLSKSPRSSHSLRAALVAVLVAIVCISMGRMLEYVQQERMLVAERESVVGELAEFRARLESTINGNVRMVHGLKAVIAAHPDMDQQMFARYAAIILSENHAVRNIGAARDMVVSLMYPLEGNESVIGLDYRAHPDQSEQAMRALESGEMVVAGPLELVQGGTAIIAREPVFLADGVGDGSPEFWGLVATVFDLETLWALSGLRELEAESGLLFAMRGRHGTGAVGEVFYGSEQLFSEQAVLSEIHIPGGSWQIGAVPAEGWEQFVDAYSILLVRISGFAVAFMMALLTFSFLRSHDRLAQSHQDLLDSQSLFSGFMDNLPAGAYIRRSGEEAPVFRNRWFREVVKETNPFSSEVTQGLVEQIRSGNGRCQSDLQAADGTVLDCECTRFVIQDDAEGIAIGGIVQDITERMSSRKELAEKSAWLRTLMDTLPDLVWVKDPEGVYLFCNRRFELLFGAAERDIIGKTDYDFVDRESADFFRRHDRAAMAACELTMNEEKTTFASDGHEETLETVKAPVRDSRGRVIGVLGVARNISGRMKMSEDLKEKVGELSRWQDVILGREERIQELKREVNERARQLGENPPYASVSDD